MPFDEQARQQFLSAAEEFARAANAAEAALESIQELQLDLLTVDRHADEGLNFVLRTVGGVQSSFSQPSPTGHAIVSAMVSLKDSIRKAHAFLNAAKGQVSDVKVSARNCHQRAERAGRLSPGI